MKSVFASAAAAAAAAAGGGGGKDRATVALAGEAVLVHGSTRSRVYRANPIHIINSAFHHPYRTVIRTVPFA
jgi:hypothetical protein